MPEPKGALNIALERLGEGEVILDLPPTDFYPAERSRIAKPPAVETRNLRLLDNIAAARAGYSILGTSPNANSVTGLFFVIFDDGQTFIVRATKSSLHSLSGTTWTDRSGAATFTSVGDTNYWAFAMVRRTGTVTPKNEIFALDGVNLVKAWTGSGNFADVASSPPGGRVVVPFLGRSLIMNHLDGGNRHHSRITRSIIGDPRTFTGTGSGFNDLDEDPYPIVKATVMSGGLAILKGDANGGALYRGTPTNVVTEPIRYDAVNRDSGVGILLPRTFLHLHENAVFYVAHDGFTIWDGIRGFQKPAPKSMRTFLNSLNQSALDAAHAWYKPLTKEIHVAIPTGGSTTPDRTWIYNQQEDRLYGPYVYGDALTSSSPFIASSAIQWGAVGGGAETMDFPGGWSTIPYSSWGAIGGSVGALVAALGSSTGDVFQDRDAITDDDNGTAINTFYETGVFRMEGRIGTGPDGQQFRFGPYDMLNLREITIEYVDTQAWTPNVQVSTNAGTTWTTISDGVELAVGSDGMSIKTYALNITAAQFQIRIQDIKDGLHALYLRGRPAGDIRNG